MPLWDLSPRSVQLITSSLDRPRRQSLHDPSLEHQHHRRNRSGGNDGGGENLPPRHLVLAAEERDRHRHGLPLRTEREREREEEFVPAIDESKNPRRRQTRHREGKQNLREALSAGSAVGVGGFFPILRDPFDWSRPEPPPERHLGGHVR